MKILVLGGTGAMGQPIVQKLCKDNDVYVTSRKVRKSTEHITYICGNATEKNFLERTLKSELWDAVVDFMVHSEKSLKELAPLFLANTRQYVFISSARVYAETEEMIKETTPRLLDVSTDRKYLKTNEYALAKAREEDILLNSGRRNFTIIRPTITYNTYRLQLGVLEKENWLYRALKGRSIVFSEDISDKITTMTLGEDVSEGIVSVIGKEKSLGEIFHITCPISLPWSEVLGIYTSVLEKHLGVAPSILMTKKSTNLKFKRRIYQVIYCRYFNRTFDNSKIAQFTDITKFTPPQQGLSNCLENFLEKSVFNSISWDIEAINDRVAGERTPLCEIPTIGSKIQYLCYRYNLSFLYKLIYLGFRVIRKIRNTIK